VNTRIATEADIPAIIELLKLSLGESLMPKTEAFWRWKHLDNPFGPSKVILAEEKGQLIGLRAFMQWTYRIEGKTYHGLRAVDTATHPQHQGKGIFKKLTLSLIDSCKADGDHFIFNTPNEKSKPGYLKMGWFEAGKMPLKLSINKPIQILANKILKKSIPTELSDFPLSDWEKLPQILEGKTLPTEQHGILKDIPFLLWRYGNCPMFPYQYLTDQKTYLLVYRLKAQAMGVELRLADFFLLNNEWDKKHFKAALKKLQKSKKVAFTSYSGWMHKSLPLPGLGLIPVMHVGPELVFRDIQMGAELPLLQKIEYSIGDLEVF
jgi:GNAT superfamily N-acetyltransferase